MFPYFVILLVAIISTSGVLLMAYFFLRKTGEKEIRQLQIELKKDRQKHFLPMRVEAYQRAVLFLERIHPSSIVMRLHNPALPAKMLQAELLKSIREEYDHNVSQQLFISPQAWEMVRNSKEEIIKLMNVAGNQMDLSSTGTDFAAKIFEIVAEVGQLPSEITVGYLKKELQELF
jgi:hypothetical protein